MKSKGIKRTLASIFAFAAMATGYIPALAPYQEFLTQAAGWLGLAGVTHAGISKMRQ